MYVREAGPANPKVQCNIVQSLSMHPGRSQIQPNVTHQTSSPLHLSTLNDAHSRKIAKDPSLLHMVASSKTSMN